MADGQRDKSLEGLQVMLSELFAAEKVDFVPDPMVLRAAELLLLGRAGRGAAEIEGEAEDVWKVIERNLDGILAFFHLLMTRERIPLIDYGITFPGQLISRLLGGLAVEVHPPPPFYEALREEALSRVAGLNLGALDPRLLDGLTAELGTAGYEWFPGDLRYENLPPGERVAATFVTGGIIFGGYAQAAGADHVLQSKRARLFTELSVQTLQEAIWGPDREEELYARLQAAVAKDGRFSAADYRLPPSVVPLLLAGKPNSTAALLEAALELREGELGVAYRSWHTSVREAWARGSRRVDEDATVREVSEEIEKRLADHRQPGADGVAPRPKALNLTVDRPPAEGDAVRADQGARPGVSNRLRNWIVERIRFRGHRKLLLRMALAEKGRKSLTEDLRDLWKHS